MDEKPERQRPRFLRLRDILAPRGPIPISRSSWWLGVKTGRFPRPLKIGPRTTVWYSADIDRLVNQDSIAENPVEMDRQSALTNPTPQRPAHAPGKTATSGS